MYPHQGKLFRDVERLLKKRAKDREFEESQILAYKKTHKHTVSVEKECNIYKNETRSLNPKKKPRPSVTQVCWVSRINAFLY